MKQGWGGCPGVPWSEIRSFSEVEPSVGFSGSVGRNTKDLVGLEEGRVLSWALGSGLRWPAAGSGPLH